MPNQMQNDTLSRLALRLREIFPDSNVGLDEASGRMYATFPNFPDWEVSIRTLPVPHEAPGNEAFQLIESSVSLRYDSLTDISSEDFHRFLAAENLGLRGLSVVSDPGGGENGLRVRTSFLAQEGATQDEAENLAIDVVSVLRFAKLLEDRVLRSTGGFSFSYELYHSTYKANTVRYINYARQVFKGSLERVFSQVMKVLREDYRCGIQLYGDNQTALVLVPGSLLEILVRLPSESPMMSAAAAFALPAQTDALVLADTLNQKINEGHFECSADGLVITYVAWKHLTNDLRIFSLDHILHHVHEAAELLRAELCGEEPMLTDLRLPKREIVGQSMDRAVPEAA